MNKTRSNSKRHAIPSVKTNTTSIDIRNEDALETVDWCLQFAFHDTQSVRHMPIQTSPYQGNATPNRKISEKIEDSEAVDALQIRQWPRLLLHDYHYQQAFIRWSFAKMFSTNPVNRKKAENMLALCYTPKTGNPGRYREVDLYYLLQANDRLREYCKRLFACARKQYELAYFRDAFEPEDDVPISKWPSRIINSRTNRLTDEARETLVKELRRKFPECDRLAPHGAAPHDIVEKQPGKHAYAKVTISFISAYSGLHRDQINTYLREARKPSAHPLKQAQQNTAMLRRLWKKYGPRSSEPTTT